MHSFDTTSSNVPAFLVKLWKLVEDSCCDDLIAWSDSGLSFLIRDQTRFSKELLPQYFKHSNMASFIRQLNMYGFRKVMNYEKSGLRNENDGMEFQHPFFVKDQGDLLELIKRKMPNTKVTEPTVKASAKDILSDLTSIREKQENMDNMLLKMKQENELLWRELTGMRQKHKQQEQIIQKVIQFLVSIVQRGNQNIGVQRKMARMLQGSPGNNVKSSQVARTIDVLRKQNSDCIISVPQDKIVSPLGPVIHEVTDFDHEEASNSAEMSNVVVNSPADSIENYTNTETVCPSESSLNSPMNTSLTMEPLSILEPLQPRIPVLTVDDVNPAETILGIPFEYITVGDGNIYVESVQEDGSVTNVISIPEDVISVPENVISIPENVISIPENVISMPDNVISVPEDKSVNKKIDTSNTISILEDTSNEEIKLDNVISIPDNFANFPDNSASDNIVSVNELPPGTSFSLCSPSMLVYSPLSKNDFDTVALQTPEIPVIHIDDVPGSSEIKEQIQVVKDALKEVPTDQTSTQEDNSGLIKSVALTNERKRRANFNAISEMGYCASVPKREKRNSLSNHVIDVEEDLKWLQDQMAANSWNIDASKLLGLFSADDVANNESLAGQIAAESNVKSEPNDIVGNELVQFNPNMLDLDLCIGNSPFSQCLTQDAEIPTTDPNSESNQQKDLLLGNVLNESVDQVAASEAAEYLLNNGTILKHNSSRRRRTPKTSKSKRRKLK